MLDDSALAYCSGDGVYIITGCSHAGICNIVEYAKKVTGKELVKGIIGGLHLFSGCSEQAVQTIAYLKANVKGTVYPCHCTNLAAKAALYGNLSSHTKISKGKGSAPFSCLFSFMLLADRIDGNG